MKRFALKATVIVAAAALTLTGCAGERGDTAPAEGGASTGASEEATTGFAADATIGVALPDKTSENWVLAGDLFTEGLEAAGFKADVQYAPASNTVAEQQNQISAMVTNGAKVIIIGAKDSKQLSTQLQAAADAGVKIIAYDRLLENSENVDYYVAFDNFKVGQLQGQALLEGLEARSGHAAPWNIELFSGSPDDPNASVFFDGAMEVLQPKIDDGTLVVVSGQTDVQQTATQGWKAENAQSRMDTLLAANYTSATLDGVLSPNDTLARAVITSVKQGGKDIAAFTVTGQDSEVESVKSIMAGEQFSTINKDTTLLVAETIGMVETLQKGEEFPTDAVTNNGVIDVPSYFLEPVIVTKENAAEAYASLPSLLEIVNAAG